MTDSYFAWNGDPDVILYDVRRNIMGEGPIRSILEEEDGGLVLQRVMDNLKGAIVSSTNNMARTRQNIMRQRTYAGEFVEQLFHEILDNLNRLVGRGGNLSVRKISGLKLMFLSKARAWGAAWSNADFADPAFAAQTGVAARIRNFTEETFAPYTAAIELYERLKLENPGLSSAVVDPFRTRQEALRSSAQGTPEHEAVRRELCEMAGSTIEASRTRLNSEVSQIRSLGVMPSLFGRLGVSAEAIRYFSATYNLVEMYCRGITQRANCSTLTQAFGRRRGPAGRGRRTNKGMHLYSNASMYF